MKKLIVAGHITEIYGPVQALRDYLISQKRDFLYIVHPFSYCSIPYSKIESYSSRGLEMQKKRRFYRIPQYIRDMLLNIYWAVRYGERGTVFIGIDNLNTMCGLILKKAGIVKQVIYYVIDYTPKRFDNKFMNWLYHYIDKLCVRHSDFIWNISSRIASEREKKGAKKEKNMIVPVGIDLDKIPKVPFDGVNKKKLVFVSHLTKSKGAQLIIEVMREIVKDIRDIKLEIIGTGPYENTLKEMAHKHGLDSYVSFLGPMEHNKLLAYLPTCGIALAPYVDDQYSITYYADATKPKEYLACGLPIIITGIAIISEEVEKNKLGIVINYNKDELIQAIKKLVLDSDFFINCKRNAIGYSKKWQWKDIYDRAFEVICAPM